MKKILSLLLAMLLVIGLLPVMALAQIGGKAENGSDITVSPVEGNARYVSANASGDNLTVNGDVTGDEAANNDSVFAAGSAKITVSGSVTEEGEHYAVRANSGSNVTVVKNITELGAEDAIFTSNDGKVFVGGNIFESDDGDAVDAYFGSSVEVTGNVTENGAGNAIQANGASTQTGAAATVTVNGSVTENDAGDAINAQSGAAVEVGDVSEDGDGNAVSASSGASVTVEGNVTESGKGFAVNASGAETIVTVNGNVDESDTGSALQAVEATIIVIGNVEEKNAGTAITAVQGANVIVGGNVTDGVETTGASDAVHSGYGATVIVEGLVTGQLNTNGQTNSGTIYLGKLNGNIKEDADLSKIHYLIGTDADSAKLSDVTLVSDIVADGTIGGVNEKGYKYTTTADATALNGKTITLKPADGKKLTVSGFDGADVTYKENVDGSVTFTIGENFTGGLQNLVLKLTDKQVPEEPEPERRSYTTVTIGNRDDKEETKTEEVKEEENPNTGAPVMSFGAVAVVLGAAFVLSKKH